MKTKAHHIRHRFPDKCRILDFLVAVDSGFRTLCEDYDACVEALQYWERSSLPEAEVRVDEYQLLIQELLAEIEQTISLWSCR